MSIPEGNWSASRPLFWGFLTVALLVGGLGAWSVMTTLAGAIIAPGQIEVSQNRQVVQHPDGGVVQEILVVEGANVEAGDVLLRLDGSAIKSEILIIENQLLELGARRARLEAQSDEADAVVYPEDLKAAAITRPDVSEILAGQTSLFAKQAEVLAQAQDQRQTRILQIGSQIEGLAAQQGAIEMQTQLLEEELITQRDLLSKGLTQATRVSVLERELAQLKGRMGELISARAEAAGRVTEIEIEITALITQQREKAEAELRDVVARQLELLERQSALAKRIARLEVRAPASGLVLGLQVTTLQSVILPADTLMYIVPQDRPLLVAARVPVTHVDEVRPGQDVRLVFSSLPTRTTPEVIGKVTLVSADALSDERTGLTYFRTEIALDAAALQQLAEVDIVPGMPVDAFIRTADRTPLSYLLKPFTDYFRNAFRET
ncbi:HlyD family type I secretion periplasmic adaptor subunit [Tabrizicola aquatica]|uniref:HlyD family type I secretion periplasmic adaptor subunit n=1 Tax=Tabrizicola aquatica TaxID=909926 RepID=UPI000CD2E201|nr:HlyD family type I secretion periplasmic adaptor subunit [Tabrizicola aquatica]